MLLSLGMKILGGLGFGDQIAKRFAWVPLALIGALAMWLIYLVATAWFDAALDEARDAGATSAIVAGQGQTLDQLGDANEAEQDLRAGGERSAARYQQCLLDSRNKPGCERYNPHPRQE